MIIKNAPRQLLYADPRKYIQSHVLPMSFTCGKCESELVLEMESDIYATKYNNGWCLGFECMVCGSKRVITKPTPEAIQQEREKTKYAELTDEQYEEKYFSSVAARARAEKHARDRRLERMYFYDYKQNLPAVLPETKPSMNRLTAFYDEILEHYVSIEKEKMPIPKMQEAVKSHTPSKVEPLDVAWATLALASFFCIFLGALWGSLWLIGFSTFWMLWSGIMVVRNT